MQQNFLVRICPRCTGIVPILREEIIYCPHSCGYSGNSMDFKLVLDDERVNQEIERLRGLLHQEYTHLSAYRERLRKFEKNSQGGE